MRRHQFHLKNYINENENTKIKMETKTCILCGEQFTATWQIVFHECDPDKIKDS